MQDRLKPLFVVTNNAHLTMWGGTRLTTREILRVDGVTDTTKKALQNEALKRYGKANASLLVRALITDELRKNQEFNKPKIDFESVTVRVELRLPKVAVDELSERAERVFSDRNYYINSLIYEHLGSPQLQLQEIEVLRNSNYEMAKIGNNLNQIAKAFNILVQMGGGGKLPEIGKKMASLRQEIKAHTNKVLRVLEAKTVVYETKGKGSGARKRK